MENKQCTHLRTDIGIDKDFIKAKKNGHKIFSLECLGRKRF